MVPKAWFHKVRVRGTLVVQLGYKALVAALRHAAFLVQQRQHAQSVLDQVYTRLGPNTHSLSVSHTKLATNSHNFRI